MRTFLSFKILVGTLAGSGCQGRDGCHIRKRHKGGHTQGLTRADDSWRSAILAWFGKICTGPVAVASAAPAASFSPATRRFLLRQQPTPHSTPSVKLP